MNYQDIASASALIKQELGPVFEKVGQGAEWGYGIFVKQVYVQALQGLLYVPAATIALIALYKSVKWIQTLDTYSDSMPLAVLATIFSSIFSLGLVIASFMGISNLIQVLVNPDYAAIQLILQTIKQ